MKKFIFGVMLLVSMLGIVGCSNPSNFEDDTYIVKNGFTDSDLNPISMTISYKNKSGVYVNEQTIPVNGIYEIPANDAKTGTIVQTSLEGEERAVPVIYVKINNEDDCCINSYFLKIGVYKVSGVGKYGDLNIVLGLNE